MSLSVYDVIHVLASGIEVIGAVVIGLSALTAIASYLKGFILNRGKPANMAQIRLHLGRGLVLGLEFLVGADILRTLLAPGFQDIIVLGAIIILRTMLSVSIEWEIGRFEEGRRTPTEPPNNQ